ncbi:MAG TPA: selenocysteine-specific translation elongation factor [Gemmatimonadales bacterium]|nr:selenocysteine-specific translation elongation factor [Gemmatimonadales bacterium]
MIIGTAGHVDHGKSALVTALTGRAMDRLAEERRRGITIELGIAPLDLGDGRVAGVVDVPGHEDFVRTMVAGASGVDVALLVVAADEGPMPQTLEHLAILEHLAVARGIPVVTKADLVEPEWLDLVVADLAGRLARSTVRFEPPVVTSAATGRGLATLRERLRSLAAALPAREGDRGGGDDAFRMPVDRAFSIAGVGTVVTGTAWSGGVAPGGAVRLLPGGAAGRVRSVEQHGAPVACSVPGARVALGIAGLERAAVRRGQVVVTDELPWGATRALDVELWLQADAPRPLVARTRVRVHHGTAELMARVHPRRPIPPGGRGLARLALEAPVVARGGDRLVLRAYSPVTTIGGGRVLDPLPPGRRDAAPELWPAALAAGEPGPRAAALVLRRAGGLPDALVPVVVGLPREAARAALAATDRIMCVGDVWVDSRILEEVRERARALVREHHRARPHEPGLPLETLRHGLAAALRVPGAVVEAALEALVAGGTVVMEGGVVRAAAFRPAVTGGDAHVDRLVALLEAAGLAPPTVGELEAAEGTREVAAALRLAARAGRVVAVERDRYVARAALDRFVDTLYSIGDTGDITPAALRERLALSRKYLIPLLEWADEAGITRRAGDGRQLVRRPRAS